MNEETMQIEYVDTMLRLAFRMEADDAAENLLHQQDQPWTAEEKADAGRILHQAWSIADQRHKEASAAAHRKRIGSILRQAGKAVACIIIVLALAFPVALAASAEFRAYVMKLMMVWDQTNGEAHFSFVKHENASFNVPEEWTGEWYPSYIPNDLQLTNIQTDMCYAEYVGNGSRKMRFSEMDEDYEVMIGTDGAEVSTLSINSMPGWIICDDSDDHAIALIWQVDDKWFKVSSFMLAKDEVIHIAESVHKIIR